MNYYSSIPGMVFFYIGFFLFMNLLMLIGYLLAKKGKKTGAWVLFGAGAGLQLISMIGGSKTGSIDSIAWFIYIVLLAGFAYLISQALAAAPGSAAQQPAGQYAAPQYPGNVPVNRVPGSADGMPAAPGWAPPAARNPQPVPQNNPFQANGAGQAGAFPAAQPSAYAPANGAGQANAFPPAQPAAPAQVNAASAADAGTASFCKSCGARLPEGSMLCPSCGAMTG